MQTQTEPQVNGGKLPVADASSGEIIQINQPRTPVPMQRATAIDPGALLQIAVEQGAPIDSLERLMALYERHKANEAESAFNESLATFKAKAVVILKNKLVDFPSKGGRTTYSHAELSDVIAAVGPALSECGFSWNWQITNQTPQWVQVTCYLKHRFGHCETASLGGPPDLSGGKNAVQAIASTVTYLQRYTLKAITGVAEAGDDMDGYGSGAEWNNQGQSQQGQKFERRPAAEQAEIESYSPEAFEKNKAQWAKLIGEGRDPERIIKTVESAGKPMTEAQKQIVRGYRNN